MSMRNKGPGIHYKFAAPENLLGWVPSKHNIDKPKEKIVSEEIVMEEIFAIWKFLRGFVRKFPATHSHNIRATMKLQRWLRKVERGRELEQMKSHFQEMIHKFVLCIYAWCGWKAKVGEHLNFSTSTRFFTPVFPFSRVADDCRMWSSFGTPVTTSTTKEISITWCFDRDLTDLCRSPFSSQFSCDWWSREENSG